jgi:hypothetical protein
MFPHQNSVCISPLPARSTCRTHVIHLAFVSRIIFAEAYKSLRSPLYSVFHSPIPAFLLNQNILLSAPVSKTLNLLTYLNMWDQVAHPYKTANKVLLCIF